MRIFDTQTLIQIASAACDSAIAQGAEFADVSGAYGKSLSVDLERNAIKSSDVSTAGGISVRAIYKGGTGWSTCDSLDIDSAARAGADAARLSKLAEPDPDFVSLPGPAESYPQVEGESDPAIADVDIKRVIGYALANIDAALVVCPDAIIEGGFSAQFSAGALVNSLGVRLARHDSYIGGHISAVVKRGDDVGSFHDFDAARVMEDFEPDRIGRSAVEQAMKFLGARKVRTGRMAVVLGPLASMSVFSGIAGNLDADDIQRGRSFMIGKLGQKIGSDAVTVIDDPLIGRGLGSRAYDSEGAPCAPLVLMENGVLKSYIYGSYTAAKAGVANTGHGTRGSGASTSNVVPKLGEITSGEIIAGTKEGIYINMGGINPNGITGDVSSSVDFGFKIENGELAYPVMSTMVGGGFLDMLANIDAVSSDYRSEPGMIMPTVRIEDVQVAGGK